MITYLLVTILAVLVMGISLGAENLAEWLYCLGVWVILTLPLMIVYYVRPV